MVALAILGLTIFLATPTTPELAQFQRLEREFFAPCGSNCIPPRLGTSFWLPDDLTTRGLTLNRPRQVSSPVPDLSSFQMPVTLNEPVRQFIRFFTGRGRFIFARWYARMGRYKPMMEKILQRHGVPVELLYVCMIESGFNTNAVSHASAVGPWQFIRTTGQMYGLRGDAWVDERRDPVKATEAAARHFKDLYRQFKSWPLALAAYNAGSGNVRLAMKRVGSNDFWRMAAMSALPNEAAQYVPKAMAAMVIGHNPSLYGFQDVELKAPLDFETVFLPGRTDTEALARRLGLKNADFDLYNPELLRGFTPPYGEEYPVRIPRRVMPVFEAKKATLKAAKPTVLTEYTVRFGEALRDVALAHGVPAWRIRTLNRLGREALREGQVLVVPSRKKNVVVGVPADDLVVLQDPGLTFKLGDRVPAYFPVRRSMTVEEVATFFGVSPGEIGVWNGIDPAASLVRGMAIKVFVRPNFDRSRVQLVEPNRVTTLPAGSKSANKALSHAQKTRNRRTKVKRYRVRRGDTLWRIATRHGITVSQLKAENGWGRRVRLKPGRRIKVPAEANIRPRGKAAKRRAKVGGRGRWYTVRRGDTLWKIARKLKSSVKKIRKRNRLRRGHLRIGQRIFVPR